jgi:hypothetical protein
VPTASQALADTQAIADRELWEAPEGVGEDWTVHPVPFQVSTSGTWFPLRSVLVPTASHVPTAGHEMAVREPCLRTLFALGTIVQPAAMTVAAGRIDAARPVSTATKRIEVLARDARGFAKRLRV